MTHTADNTDRQETRMSTYDIDPGLIAALDQRMSATSHDLDECIKSFLIHRDQTDSAIAHVVLTDNMIQVLTLEAACEVLALAVQRLAEHSSSVGGTTTSSEEQA